jgi:hypothetical protein
MLEVSLSEIFMQGRCGPFFIGQPLEDFKTAAQGLMDLPEEFEGESYDDGEVSGGMYDFRTFAGFVFQRSEAAPHVLYLHCISFYLPPFDEQECESIEMNVDFEGIRNYSPFSECLPVLERFGMKKVTWSEGRALPWYRVGEHCLVLFEDFEEAEECEITAIELVDVRTFDRAVFPGSDA